MNLAIGRCGTTLLPMMSKCTEKGEVSTLSEWGGVACVGDPHHHHHHHHPLPSPCLAPSSPSLLVVPVPLQCKYAQFTQTTLPISLCCPHPTPPVWLVDSMYWLEMS
ncbi:unnamed protein product [Gadus morhua 'NCC']